MSQKSGKKSVSQSTQSQSSNTSTSSTSKISAQVGVDAGRSSQSVHKRPRLSDINAELTCILCNGYFIDATTISECLHSFCKSCIVQYLETNKICPICEAPVNETKPLSSIRSDTILQDIVYKLIPDVFKNEMERRRDFYTKHTDVVPTSAEDRGEITDHRMFYMANDQISLSLEYGYGENQIPDTGYNSTQASDKSPESETMKRYLLCPADFSILHLKKFIARKYGLPTTYKVDVMYLEDILNEDYTLMDVAYIYAWRRSDPMRLFYRISERPIKRLKTSHPQTVEAKSGSGNSVNNNKTTDMSDSNNNNKCNNSGVSGVVSQSKLVQTQPASCTSRTTSSTQVVTGAAHVKAHNSSNMSNNSGATGVTSGKASTATPRRADPSKSVSTASQAVNTQPTPPGIFKSKTTHKSASAVQTDEPPKKLRKILPANNSSVSTPKPQPTDSANTSKTTPPVSSLITSNTSTSTSTSTSTVNSLRQCRINSDKTKLSTNVSAIGLNTSANLSPNVGLSVSNQSVKSDTKCVTSDNNAKKNSGRKCSAFDVRTLIGTKSPTLQCSRHSIESMSGTECIECNEEKAINDKNWSSVCKSAAQTPKQSKASARELNCNKLNTSQSSMTSTLPLMTSVSAQNKKQVSSSPSVEIPSGRPPTNKSGSHNDRTAESQPSVDCLPSKQSKTVTNLLPKQLSVSTKSLKSETTSKSYTNRDMTSDNKYSKTSIRANTGTKSDSGQAQSTPLSPTSIRIKLPTPPQSMNTSNKNSSKTSAVNSKTSSSSTPAVASTGQTSSGAHHNNKVLNHSIDSFVSKQLDSKKQLFDNKTTDLGQKSVGNSLNGNQSHTKSSTGQSSSKTKGASINQIVNKIASGVTAKSASVNVTSTTPTLELKTKPKPNANPSQLNSSSNQVTPNELNDNKVSTTTTDSNVGASIHKNETPIKSVSAVTSAATNSGNLVIRISTKTHSVESLVSPKDREKKFEIKKDLSNTGSNSSPNNSFKTNNCSDSQIDQKIDDKGHRNQKEIKTSDKSDDNEEEDDDDIDGKLVVDVPTDDSCGSDLANNKNSNETEGIVNSKERSDVRAGENSIRSQNSAVYVKPTKVPSDISTKLAINISTAHQLSANSAVLASPPPTPTPSPKSESDPIVTNDNKSNSSSSSSSNGPLDLSMSAKKERKPNMSLVPVQAIYDIPPPKPKPKPCMNPAVQCLNRGLFDVTTNPHKQYQSFNIQSQGIRHNTGGSKPNLTSSCAPNLEISKKNRLINSSIVSSNTTSNQSNSSRHRSQNNNSQHHSSHHNNKPYSVITPDPHHPRQAAVPRLVIKNIGSPPSITSHFNYQTHH